MRQFHNPKIRHCAQISAAALVLSTSLSSAADLLRWDVTSTTTSTSGSAATAVMPGVSGSIITSGSGSTGGNTSSPAGTWNRTFATVTTDSVAAQTAGNTFSFTTTVSAGYTASISGIGILNFDGTSNRPLNAGLFYSTDGGSTYIQTGTNSGTSGSANPTFSSTLIVTPLVIAGGATGATVNWRIVVWNGGGGRMGIVKGAGADFTLTGTSVSDAGVPNLLWTGTGGNDWNTTPGNTNWADLNPPNAAAPFVTDANVTINIPATVSVDALGVTAGTVTVSNATGTVALSGGSITGVSLVKSAAGTLSIAGTNNFLGGVAITDGVIQMENNTAIGTDLVTVNGGTLKTSSGVTTVMNALRLETGGATIETAADVTFSGSINESASGRQLNKSGAGQLTLTGNLGTQITYPVDLDITAGSVALSGAGQKNVGGTNTLNGDLILNGPILMLHGSTMNGSGSLISNNASSSITSRLNEGPVGISNAVLLNANLSLESPNGNNLLALSGPIGGANGLIKKGNGIVTLSGSNTYTGVTTINAGDLRANTLTNGDVASSIGAASSAASNLVLNGGALLYAAETPTTTDRSFSVTGNGGEISSIGSGTVQFTNTSAIAMTPPVAIAATTLANGTTYKIISTGDTDFTVVGAADSNVGTVFVATGAGTGTGTAVVFGASRTLRLAGSTAGTNVLASAITNAISGPVVLAKNETTTWSLTGTNTYTGSTNINGGILLITGNNSGATGTINVAATAALGGNGASGAPVVLQSGGGLAAKIADWNGAAGIGYDDLTVASLDAAAVPMTVKIDSTGLSNFTEVSKSFTIMNTGGITNFSAANVTITALGFPGTGIWSLAQSGSSLVLSYTAGVAANYSTWATANGIPGEPAGGDFDKDGITNLVEYALGLNPTISSVPAGTFNGSAISFTKGTAAKANGDVTYEIEQSTTLTGWVVVVPNDTNAAGISYTLPAGQPREFARLKITQVP